MHYQNQRPMTANKYCQPQYSIATSVDGAWDFYSQDRGFKPQVVRFFWAQKHIEEEFWIEERKPALPTNQGTLNAIKSWQPRNSLAS